MPGKTRKVERRTEALSREQIVEAAVELLDATGEGGLTFRALSERLATGAGALYWHVANKGELLDAATDGVIAAVLAAQPSSDAAPEERLGTIALGLFDALEQHPWLAPQLAAQLSRPWKPVTPRILESIGQQVRALGVPEQSWFTVAGVLMHYILGAASQNAVNHQTVHSGEDVPRSGEGKVLDAVTHGWEKLDPHQYPFTRAIAAQARQHDDRHELLAGIALILAGVRSISPGRVV